MSAVIDTCFFSYTSKNPEAGVAVLVQFKEIYLPVISYGEIISGFKSGNRYEKKYA